MDTRNKKNKETPHIFAPFLLLKVEKMYYYWIASFAISFLSILYDLCSSNIENSFTQGAFYSTCIAVLAPFLVEFFIGYSAKFRSSKGDKYPFHKGASLGLCFIAILWAFLCYATPLKTNRVSQIILTVLVGILSFYLYLVSKMDMHPTLLKPYEEKSYAETEKDLVKGIQDKAQNITSVQGSDGKEVKL